MFSQQFSSITSDLWIIMSSRKNSTIYRFLSPEIMRFSTVVFFEVSPPERETDTVSGHRDRRPGETGLAGARPPKAPGDTRRCHFFGGIWEDFGAIFGELVVFLVGNVMECLYVFFCFSGLLPCFRF